ncbi:hypothetical protein OG920_32215 [Streptomyces europaeiscabiei]|uniref:hypothetical protein n=1 Tax=Streptomyces TaxID=1883 RepID=UPI00118066E6|nr:MULTISPECIES: hypothetical protein [Streptomyces]MDX3634999.1 hypothetical protein [Streptomyces europaeiscabiei]MDX3651681.1 hypothetical protein [Streptomyces europaeiscabiei]WUD35744.1 hypothetical protein OG858_32890 [Streptomyces europaeiscabiei]
MPTGRARVGADGRYHGDLPCRWCETLIDQAGRRRPRPYCRMSHRWKNYGAWIVGVVGGIF